jgi:hypothetical protein
MIMWLPHTHLEFYQAITLLIYTPAILNKTARKKLFSEIITIILALHKLGYSASRIKEEGLTKDIPKFSRSDARKSIKIILLLKLFELRDLLS